MNLPVLILTLAILASGVSAAPAKAPSVNPGLPATAKTIGSVLEQVGIKPQLGNEIPLDLPFVDSNNETATFRKCMNGRPTIVQLVYYDCPMLCQLSRDGLMSTLATINLKLGDDYS